MRVTLLGVLVAMGTAAADAPIQQARPKATAGMVAHLSITDGGGRDEAVTAVTAPVTIRYEVENTSKVPVTLWHAAFWPNHRITLTDARGTPVAPSKTGKAYANAFSPQGMRDKNVEWIVKPGAKDASEGNYDLRLLAPLDTPGRYTVRVAYEEDILFESNTVTFWRVRAGAPAEVLALDRGIATADHIAALRKLGVEVALDPATGRYRITSAK